MVAHAGLATLPWKFSQTNLRPGNAATNARMVAHAGLAALPWKFSHDQPRFSNGFSRIID
jgi:hypothetical protein